MRLRRRQPARYRPPKTKKCQHFETVARACLTVLDGRMPPSELGTQVLAEEYLMLHLEFEALRTHLEERSA